MIINNEIKQVIEEEAKNIFYGNIKLIIKKGKIEFIEVHKSKKI